jgi:hypothetical protein
MKSVEYKSCFYDMFKFCFTQKKPPKGGFDVSMVLLNQFNIFSAFSATSVDKPGWFAIR